MARSQSIARGNFFLALLCDDGFACHSRHGRHLRPADAGCSSVAWEIYCWASHACRSGRALLAFRGHRLDFSFSADVSGGTPIMETSTHSPKVYWTICAALMMLLALTWSIGYVDVGWFNLVVVLAISDCNALVVALLFMYMKGSSGRRYRAGCAGSIYILIIFSRRL